VHRGRLHYFIGMALTILVAGIGKDERARIEGAVKAALGWRGLTETWSVSLVRVGSQWSVTLSGPGEAFRNLSFGATEQELSEKITAAIGGGDAPPAAAPSPQSTPYATEPYAPPSHPRPPYSPAQHTPVPPVPTPPAPAVSAPRPAPVRTPQPQVPPQRPVPATTHVANRDDCWTCIDCGGVFKVLYEHRPGDTLVMAAVACPHCWKLNHVEIGSWAAEGRDYRAEKA
jgi:hypothetical protein